MGPWVAVPPLRVLCINRALTGALCGLFSGLGVASADALAAGIAAALGISLISRFFSQHQFMLGLIGGVFLCYLGYKVHKTEAVA